MSPSRAYHPIDEAVAEVIFSLHESHSNLGHNGLLNALKDDGIEIDPKDLERFMDQADIEGEGCYWKRNNIRGYLKILGFAHDDPLKEGGEYVN